MGSDYCEIPVLFLSRLLKQNVKLNIWKFNDGNYNKNYDRKITQHKLKTNSSYFK